MVLQAGCVTGRRELTLTAPTDASVKGATVGRVFLATVTDDRQFQNKPGDPSTPSIDGDVTKLSTEDKDRMVGRQRNGFGHAMGDVSLAGNDSVTKEVRSLVKQGLQRNDYRLTQDSDAPNVMKISTTEFWSWTPAATQDASPMAGSKYLT